MRHYRGVGITISNGGGNLELGTSRDDSSSARQVNSRKRKENFQEFLSQIVRISSAVGRETSNQNEGSSFSPSITIKLVYFRYNIVYSSHSGSKL